MAHGISRAWAELPLAKPLSRPRRLHLYPKIFPIGKLEVNNGKLTLASVGSKAKPQVFDKVNIDVTDFSFTSKFPFELTAKLPGGGDADLSGKAGPINPQDAAKTPVEASVKVNDMDLATSGFIDPASGIGGLAKFEGTLNSDGSQAKAAGQVTCEKIKLSPKGTPASKAINVKYGANLDLSKQAGTITQGDVSIGKAVAHLTGAFQTQGESQVLNLRLNAPNIPVDELEAMLPAAGIVLPSGSQLQGGTLSADLGITGPVDKLIITGPVRLANTQLAGFDLGSKLGALSASLERLRRVAIRPFRKQACANRSILVLDVFDPDLVSRSLKLARTKR